MAYEEMMMERYKTIRVKYAFDKLYVIVVAKKRCTVGGEAGRGHCMRNVPSLLIALWLCQ